MEEKLLYSDIGLSTFTKKQEESESIVWTGAKRESQLDLIEKKLDILSGELTLLKAQIDNKADTNKMLNLESELWRLKRLSKNK